MNAIVEICKDMAQAKRCRTLKRNKAKGSPIYGRKAALPQKAHVCPVCRTAFHEGEACPMCGCK